MTAIFEAGEKYTNIFQLPNIFFWGGVYNLWVFPKMVVPMMENPIKVDDLGGNPLFSEISISLKSQFSGGVFPPYRRPFFLCGKKGVQKYPRL